MKIVITQYNRFKAKTGTEYVKCAYLAENGSVGEIFTTAEKFDEYKLPESRLKLDFSDLFSIAGAVSEVDFDSKGQLQKVS